MFSLVRFAPIIVLGALCLVFYTAMHFYAQSAMEAAQGEEAVYHVLQLRVIFSLLFSVLLGFLGVKMSGHVWPAMLAHTLVVALMLLLDIPWEQLTAHWDITLLILGLIAGVTGVASGITLGIFWLLHRYQFRKPRKKIG